jgi:hypothetical protein
MEIQQLFDQIKKYHYNTPFDVQCSDNKILTLLFGVACEMPEIKYKIMANITYILGFEKTNDINNIFTRLLSNRGFDYSVLETSTSILKHLKDTKLIPHGIDYTVDNLAGEVKNETSTEKVIDTSIDAEKVIDTTIDAEKVIDTTNQHVDNIKDIISENEFMIVTDYLLLAGREKYGLIVNDVKPLAASKKEFNNILYNKLCDLCCSSATFLQESDFHIDNSRCPSIKSDKQSFSFTIHNRRNPLHYLLYGNTTVHIIVARKSTVTMLKKKFDFSSNTNLRKVIDTMIQAATFKVAENKVTNDEHNYCKLLRVQINGVNLNLTETDMVPFSAYQDNNTFISNRIMREFSTRFENVIRASIVNSFKRLKEAL